MDKILFVGVGHAGLQIVKKINEELKMIQIENNLQENSVCFLPTTNGMEESSIPCYGLNDMDQEHGHGYTSRRGISEYREVAEDLSEDIRAILQQYLDDKKD